MTGILRHDWADESLRCHLEWQKRTEGNVGYGKQGIGLECMKRMQHNDLVSYYYHPEADVSLARFGNPKTLSELLSCVARGKHSGVLLQWVELVRDSSSYSSGMCAILLFFLIFIVLVVGFIYR